MNPVVRSFAFALALNACAAPLAAQGTRATTTYKRFKSALDAVPAIDTHDHLWPFESLPGYVETAKGRGMNLAALWRNSYTTWYNRLTPWKPGQSFESWWAEARDDFDDARASSFYRYQLPAFADLYGVDFDKVTDAEAARLDGGYPWIGETGVIVQRQAAHVWIDSVWLPMLSYSTAKRAFHEWLEAMPSSRLLWGADCNHAEGIYGATEFTRRCLAEVLAEKVDAGDLQEDHALRIGRQILRDNALALFPQLKERLWKHRGKKLEPPAAGGAKRPSGAVGEGH